MNIPDCQEHIYIYTHEGNAHHSVYHYHENDCPFCEIARLTEENARLREALSYEQPDAIVEKHIESMVERVVADNQRMRAALEYITKQGTGHYADKRLSEIAREALEWK